jgi:hypothetical protein
MASVGRCANRLGTDDAIKPDALDRDNHFVADGKRDGVSSAD